MVGAGDFHFELLFFLVIVEHFNRLPHVLVDVEHWRKTVRLSWSSLTVIYPLLWGSVLIPSVITGENLGAWNGVKVEDLVLLFKNFKCFLGC